MRIVTFLKRRQKMQIQIRYEIRVLVLPESGLLAIS
jgi:hypothetical protein